MNDEPVDDEPVDDEPAGTEVPFESTGPMWGTLGTQGLDEVPLCPHCLIQIRPDAHFCKRCMAPVSSYASFGFLGSRGNYESIWSTAWILHQAATTKMPRRIHVVGVLLTFAPGLLITIFYLADWLMRLGGLALRRGPQSLNDILFVAYWFLPSAFWLYVSGAFTWRTWRNYRDRSHPVENVFE